MNLPHPEQSVISADKLEGYSLNLDHSEGRHKAIVFQSALGIELAEAEVLRSALKQAAFTQTPILAAQTLYGQK